MNFLPIFDLGWPSLWRDHVVVRAPHDTALRVAGALTTVVLAPGESAEFVAVRSPGRWSYGRSWVCKGDVAYVLGLYEPFEDPRDDADKDWVEALLQDAPADDGPVRDAP